MEHEWIYSYWVLSVNYDSPDLKDLRSHINAKVVLGTSLNTDLLDHHTCPLNITTLEVRTPQTRASLANRKFFLTCIKSTFFKTF